MQPTSVETSRIHLLTAVGADPMGTFWHAYDLARQCAIRVHELQGAHSQTPPAMPPGHELVREAGRVFVILPTATPASPRRASNRVGWLVGGVAAAVSLIVIAAALLLTSGLNGTGEPSAAAAATAPAEPAQTGPVNAALVTMEEGDCAYAVTFSTDPTAEVGAQVTECDDTSWTVHTALFVRTNVAREDVPDMVEIHSETCFGNTSDDPRLVWASTDGRTGNLICFN